MADGNYRDWRNAKPNGHEATVKQDFSLIVQRVKSGTGSITKEAPKMLAFVATLAEVEDLTECKAQAAAITEYLAQRKDGSVAEYNAAVKIRTRVDHRLGEVLAETVKRGGDRKSKSHDVTLNGPLPKEITKMQSSRAQQLAAIPWSEIETRIDQATEGNERASQAKIVNELRPKENGHSAYDVMDDVKKFHALRDKLCENWKREEDKMILRQSFRQMANEV